MNGINPNNANAGNLIVPEMPIADRAAPENAESKPIPDVLEGPALSVTTPDPAIVANLRQADYDSKMATAKNLVDDPKTRREKAERRKEEETEAALAKADEIREEQKRELLDQVDANRQSAV